MKFALRTFFEDSFTFEGDECRIWPFSKTGPRGKTGRDGGYAQIRLADQRRYLVHKLVCEATHGPPPTPRHHAAHNCGTHLCVNKRHIRWKTPKENAADKKPQGRQQDVHGEHNGNATMTPALVQAIRDDLRSGQYKYQRQIARKYGVNDAMISRLKLNSHYWKHIK